MYELTALFLVDKSMNHLLVSQMASYHAHLKGNNGLLGKINQWVELMIAFIVRINVLSEPQREANYSHEVLRFGGDARQLPVAGAAKPGQRTCSQQYFKAGPHPSESDLPIAGEGRRQPINCSTGLCRPETPSSHLPGTGTGMKESHPHLPAASSVSCTEGR